LFYFTENALKESELCIGYVLSGWKIVSSLIWTLKSKQDAMLSQGVPRDAAVNFGT